MPGMLRCISYLRVGVLEAGIQRGVKENASSTERNDVVGRRDSAAHLKVVSELWSLVRYSIVFEYILTASRKILPLFEYLLLLRKRGL